jgi:hypothetical protein
MSAITENMWRRHERPGALGDQALHLVRARDHGPGVDVGEHRPGPEVAHRARERGAAESRHHDLVACADAHGVQHQRERARAAAACDDVRRAQLAAQRLLEPGGALTEDEPLARPGADVMHDLAQHVPVRFEQVGREERDHRHCPLR